MAANNLPRTLQPPPDLPDIGGQNNILANYLRTFALWCRRGFADKLSISTAGPGLMLQGYDAPVGTDPKVYFMEVSNAGHLALAPMAQGSGDMGVPVMIGTGDYLPLTGGIITGNLDVNGYVSCHGFMNTDGWTQSKAPSAADNTYFALMDSAGTNRGYIGWTQSSNDVLFVNTTNNIYLNLNATGAAVFSCPLTVSGALTTNAGIKFGDYWGNTFRFGFDGTNGILNLKIDSIDVYLPISQGFGSYVQVRNQFITGGFCYWQYVGGQMHWAYTNGFTVERLKASRAAPRDALQVIEQIPVREIDLVDPLRDDPLHFDFAIVPDDIRSVLPEAFAQDIDNVASLCTDPIVAMLVRAVQQLSARVEALEAAR